MDSTVLDVPKQESLDFARAFRFVFDDPDWIKKVLMGSLFTLLAALLVGTVFLAGYFSRLIQRTARGERYPLPDWDDLGGLFFSGVRAVGVYSVHLLAVALPLFGVGLVVALTAGGLSASGNETAARGLGAQRREVTRDVSDVCDGDRHCEPHDGLQHDRSRLGDRVLERLAPRRDERDLLRVDGVMFAVTHDDADVDERIARDRALR